MGGGLIRITKKSRTWVHKKKNCFLPNPDFVRGLDFKMKPFFWLYLSGAHFFFWMPCPLQIFKQTSLVPDSPATVSQKKWTWLCVNLIIEQCRTYRELFCTFNFFSNDKRVKWIISSIQNTILLFLQNTMLRRNPILSQVGNSEI